MDSNSGLFRSSPGAALGREPQRPGSSCLLLSGPAVPDPRFQSRKGVGGAGVFLAEVLSPSRRP